MFILRFLIRLGCGFIECILSQWRSGFIRRMNSRMDSKFRSRPNALITLSRVADLEDKEELRMRLVGSGECGIMRLKFGFDQWQWWD